MKSHNFRFKFMFFVPEAPLLQLCLFSRDPDRPAHQNQPGLDAEPTKTNKNNNSLLITLFVVV